MNRLFIFLIVLIVAAAGCGESDCRKVIESLEDGTEKLVFTYPNCKDTSYYLRQGFYQNKQLSFEGYVKDGANEGIWKTWTFSGVQTAEWDNKEGKEHGFIQCWYDNGVKSKESTLKLGIMNGEYKEWDIEGNLQTTGQYINDKKEGKFIFHLGNGQWTERNYKKDLLEGYTHEHILDNDGTLLLVNGQFVNNLETGRWEWYDKDSILIKYGDYLDGKIEGEVHHFFKNGSPWIINLYKNDSLIETKTAYDKDGNITLNHGKGKIYYYKDEIKIDCIASHFNSKKNGLMTMDRLDEVSFIRMIQ